MDNEDDDEKLINLSMKISGRTKARLIKIVNNKKTTVASIIRQIANRYVGFGVIAERRREHSMPRPIIEILFSDLSEEQKQTIEEEYYMTALIDLKSRYPEINCDTVQSALLTWARFNDLNFNIETVGDDDKDLWILCQHVFGKNWQYSFQK